MNLKNYLVISLSVLMFFSFNNFVNAQGKKHIKKTIAITTNDGNIFIGKLLKETNKIIRIKTKSAGNITIKKNNIRSIDFNYTQGSSIKNEIKTTNKYKDYPSRYFLGTSGYNLKKGEGYYANTWVFINELNYGITDYFSAGVGVVPLFLFAGTPSPVWLKTKFSYPVLKDKLNVSGGIMAGAVIGLDIDFTVPTFFYAAATVGNRNNNITLSFNYGYVEGEFSPGLYTLSGKYKVSRRTFLMTDNYFILDNETDFTSLSMFGARTMFKGLTLDYGAILPIGEFIDSDIYIYPYLGIKIGLGK